MKIKYIFLSVAFVLSVSCSDFLKEDLRNKVNEKDYFKTIEDCDLAVNGCYSYLGMKQHIDANWYGAFQPPTIMTDEVVWKSMSSMRNISFCDLSEKDAGVYNIWKGSYSAINWANRVIKGLQTSPAFDTEEQRNMYIAQAKFIRAVFYFNLVRFFGDVPLITEPGNEIADVAVSRAPMLDVYDLIISDLKDGKANLPLKSAAKQGQATKGAASALLAKVYAQMSGRPLYLDRWEDAKAECEYVMGLSGSPLTGTDGYALYDSYFNLFHPDHEGSCEVIFDVQFGEGELYGSNLGTYYSGVGGNISMGGRGGGNTAFIVPEHYKTKYKENTEGVRDPRWDRNIGDYSMGNKNSNVLNKLNTEFTIKKFARLDTETTGYMNNWQTNGNPTNVIMLRLADIYLLYAESINEINHAPNAVALEYVNMVRRRAWKKDISTPDPTVDLSISDYESFHKALMDERCVELCFEGHRWFDLVRWNRLIEVVKATTQPAAQNIQERHYFYPIPEDERRLNPNLTQNPGWAGGTPLEPR